MIRPLAEPPNVMVQRLHPAVIAALNGQWRDLFNHAGWDPSAVVSLLSMPGYLGLMAKSGADVAGLLMMRIIADESEILWIAVLPQWRRRGIGHSLLDSAAQIAVGLGAHSSFLEVAKDNPAAIALYRGASFEPVGCRKGYYARGPRRPACDALVYKKLLNSGARANDSTVCAQHEKS